MEVIMTEEQQNNVYKNKHNLRNLRVSLRYRPDIFKLILKMRQCIKKKNSLIIKLKCQLKLMEKKGSNTPHKCDQHTSIADKKVAAKNNDVTKINQSSNVEINKVRDSSTQTDGTVAHGTTQTSSSEKLEDKKEFTAWNINKEGNQHKSIADQVKEVAQDAMQQSGMVYIESAGMYYDYKTGYYYNSELGLYYHTKTGCYYYYSEEKQTFVFHSFPDRSVTATNAALNAYEKRKARKLKKEMKKEDDIENLTKNLSQDKEEDALEPTKPKRRKGNKKLDSKKNDITNDDEDKITLKPNTSDETNKEKTNASVNDLKKTEKDVIENISRKKAIEGDKELEDGECSETDSEESLSEEDNKHSSSTSTASDDETIAKHHPPCMRVIVRETNLPKLKVGTLFLITKDGGTVGREGEQHVILIKDQNVSKNHLDIRYDMFKKTYVAMDLGSKNGTVLNGIRMSESQVVSEPVQIVHGSTIQLGETKLLCHIHPGNDTCGHCEPGLVMEMQEKEKKVAYTRTCSVQKQHELELARLKNKYAPTPLMIEDGSYNDRAKARRDAVGSSHHAEKTQSADLNTCIASENKGFKLLEKMGWSKGEGLGKDNQGGTEPIPLVNNENKAGLGAAGSSAPQLAAPTKVAVNRLGSGTLRLAKKTKMLNPPAKAFQVPLDEDSD